MAKTHKDPGNSLQGQIEFQEQLYKEAIAIRRIEGWIKECPDAGRYIDGIRLSIKDDEGTDVLLIVTSSTDDGFFVTFVGGTGLLDCLVNLSRLAPSGRMKWKPDEFRNKRADKKD